jgi:ABC-type oligopeptide transport system ATPase subunit
MMIELEGVVRRYAGGEQLVTTALDDASFTIAETEAVAITGPSGSGKSTLLHLIGGLDRPDKGLIRVAGTDLAGLRGDSLAAHRRRVGFVFQRFFAAITHQQVAVIQNYWSSGPTAYRRLAQRTVEPIPVVNPMSVWRSDYMSTGVVDPPIDAELAGFRPLHPHVGAVSGGLSVQLPSLRAVGTFDPTKLPGFSPLSPLPLSRPTTRPSPRLQTRVQHACSMGRTSFRTAIPPDIYRHQRCC